MWAGKISEVYRNIIGDSAIDKNIRSLTAQFDNPPDVIVLLDALVAQSRHVLRSRQQEKF